MFIFKCNSRFLFDFYSEFTCVESVIPAQFLHISSIDLSPEKKRLTCQLANHETANIKRVVRKVMDAILFDKSIRMTDFL